MNLLLALLGYLFCAFALGANVNTLLVKVYDLMHADLTRDAFEMALFGNSLIFGAVVTTLIVTVKNIHSWYQAKTEGNKK